MDVGLALEEEGASAVDASLLPQQCCVLSAPGDSPGAFGPRRPRCDFYIIGTAHVSANSCEDVRRVIQLVRPEVCSAITQVAFALGCAAVLRSLERAGCYAGAVRGAEGAACTSASTGTSL